MNKLSKLLYLLCTLSVFSLMALFAFHEQASIFDSKPEQTYCMIEDYTYSSVTDASAPCGILQEYHWTLRDIPLSNGVVLFYFTHQEVEVTIGNRLVYSLAIDPQNYFSEGVGFGVVKIPVYPEDEGQLISLKVRPVYKSSIHNKLALYFGDYSKIALEIIKEDGPVIIICILCSLIGLVMLIFSMIKLLQKKSHFETLCMSIFATFTGLWKLTDIRATSLFISKSLLMSALSILCMPIMATSFVFYLRYQFSASKRRLWTYIGILYSSLTLLIVFIQVLKLADIKQTLFISHFMIILLIVLSLSCIINEFRSGIASHKVKAIFAFVIICMCGTIMDLIIFYSARHSEDTFYGITAFFVYIVYTGLLSLQDAVSLIRQGRSAKHYEELALHDELTGLYSRVFFKQYTISHQQIQEPCYLIMFDVNNLKECNDTRGHSNGDILLRNASHLIEAAFLPDGKCIRLSGDEFCVILEINDEAVVKKHLAVFSNATYEFNENNPDTFPIRVAYGYACFDPNLDLDLNDTLKRADKRMYEMKHQMKQQKDTDTT